MNIHLHLVRMATLILFFSNCGSPVEPPQTGAGELMPLQAGNYWIYQIWPFATPDTARAEITRKVSVRIDGVTYEASAFLLPYPVNGPRPPFEWLYWNGPEGLYWLGGVSETDTFLYKTLLFKYPANVGDSWRVRRINYNEFDGKFYFFDTLVFGLVSKDEEIETPAGTFKCYVYKYRRRPADDVAEEWDYYHYYYPEIGRVAYITRGISDNRIIDRMYLISHFVFK